MENIQNSFRKFTARSRSTTERNKKDGNDKQTDAFYIDFSKLVEDIRDNVSYKRDLSEMAQPTFLGLLPSSADIVSDTWQVRIQPLNNM